MKRKRGGSKRSRRRTKRERKVGVYKRCFDFLRENKNYFWIVSVLFLIFIIFGYLFPIFFVDFILEFIEQLTEKTKDMGAAQLILFIIKNNAMSSFFGVVFGIVFGIFPLLSCFFNGYVLGFIMRKVVGLEGPFVLWRLLPHGIFEIPALIISLGLGLRIGMFILAKDKSKDLKYSLENSLRIFLYIVLPLLIVAGIIEGLFVVFVG